MKQQISNVWLQQHRMHLQPTKEMAIQLQVQLCWVM
jgi:hypothetical protein